MRFVSTRGSPRSYSFTQALVSGAGDDGGLLLPEAIPEVPQDVQAVWRRLSFPSLLERILQLFVDPTEEGGSASKLTEALPYLVSAAFRQTDNQDALEVQAIRLLRRRQRKADGSFWGSCVPDEPTRERPSIFSLLLRAARDRSGKKDGEGTGSRGKCRRIGMYELFNHEGGESGVGPSASGYGLSSWFGAVNGDSMNPDSNTTLHPAQQLRSRWRTAASKRRRAVSTSNGLHPSMHLKHQFKKLARHQASLSKQISHGEADELFLLRAKEGAHLSLNVIAMKLTAQLLDFLQTAPGDHLHLIILCATTGDTGLAAAEGAFTDCQAMVQGALRSRRLRDHLALREVYAEKMEGARAAQETGPAAALRRLQLQQQRQQEQQQQLQEQQAMSLHQQPSQGSDLAGDGETGGGDITDEVNGLSLTPLQSRHFSLGRESGSFVRLPSHAHQKLLKNKRVAGEGAGGPHRASQSQPLRLCAEEQAAALQELLSVASTSSNSSNSSVIARDVSSATAPAALASGGGGASPRPSSMRGRPHHLRDLSLMSEASEPRSEGSAVGQQHPGGWGAPAVGGGPLEVSSRPPNVIVPSGSYAVLFAAYFALAMGAPLGHLVPCVSASSVARELGKNTRSDQVSTPPHSLTEPAGLSAGEPLLAEEGPVKEDGETGEGEEGAAEEGEIKGRKLGGGPRFIQSLSSSYSGLPSMFQRMSGGSGSRQKQERLRKQSQESELRGFNKPFDDETLSQDREATVKSRIMRPFRSRKKRETERRL
ncbi:hypothetical protein Emag_001267 [Eimeria magna]